MHANQAAQKLWLQREPALYFSNRLNQIVKRPQTRFSGGSAASRRAPTVLTSFSVLARVIYALNASTCSAGRGSVLSGIHSPGRTSLVSLNARAVVPCWGWRVGVAVRQKKEVCESTSAWTSERGPWAAAVTQLLAAVLQVSARRTAGKLKGRTQCRAGPWRSLTKDFWHQTAAQSHSWKPVCCFPWATQGFFLFK